MTRLTALLLLTACAGHTPPANVLPKIPLTADALIADSIATTMVQQAFDADAKLGTPDSLYLPTAEVIANGVPRADPPRFAGVGADGSVQLGSSRFSITGSYVWGSVQYRWLPPTLGMRMVDGWATIVIVRLKEGGWRIAHVHSSTARSDST